MAHSTLTGDLGTDSGHMNAEIAQPPVLWINDSNKPGGSLAAVVLEVVAELEGPTLVSLDPDRAKIANDNYCMDQT